MRKGKLLKKGGSIALVAPSFGCTSEPYKTRLKVAINNLKECGYEIIEGENIHLQKDKVRSNTPKKCAKEFMKAYETSDVTLSVGGGEIMCEILPYVNFERIKKCEPKTFMGFSDNTKLTYTLATICEVESIYGPNACSFAFTPFTNNTLDALNLLEGKVKEINGYEFWEKDKVNSDNPLQPSNLTEKKIIKTYPKIEKIEINGRLLGGCLDCLINLCGTRFDHTKEYVEKYKDDGIIWFLEACDLSPLGIERALFQLKEAGWFKYAKGILFGRPLCFKNKMFGVDHYSAYKRALKGMNIPLIMDIDLGHFDPSMPIITGAKANVIYENNNIKFIYE